jgi:hypothetical protein
VPPRARGVHAVDDDSSDEAFDVTAEDERELREREHECERGETVTAREFLAELQGHGDSDG